MIGILGSSLLFVPLLLVWSLCLILGKVHRGIGIRNFYGLVARHLPVAAGLFLLSVVALLLRDGESFSEICLWSLYGVYVFHAVSRDLYAEEYGRLLFRFRCGSALLAGGVLLLMLLERFLVIPRSLSRWGLHLFILVETAAFLFLFFRDLFRNRPVSDVSRRKTEVVRIALLTAVFSYLLLSVSAAGLWPYLVSGVLNGANLLWVLLTFFSRELLPLRIAGDEKEKYPMIRSRLVEYFDKEKPYLRQDLKINDVALAIFTNKTYISRVLNESMNMNFNQYVNSYRIREAQRLFMENQELKMNELSEMCGFRTIPSFYKAFKDNVGDSPANWCRSRRRKTKAESDKEVVGDAV